MQNNTCPKPAGGYHGRYLKIDLTQHVSEWVSLENDVLRNFLGGSGLGVHLLLRESAADFAPLSREACIAFAFSPLVGSPLTTSAKFAVVSKSPLTDRINDSLASSGFAIAGKRSGCDGIVITGKAREPSILIIDDGHMRIEPAGELWGMECSAAEGQLSKRLGAEFQCAVIGPAGERLVPFATISHDGRHAGRGGSGAVLGAKNIKAIAVRGSQLCAWADPVGLNQFAKTLSKKSFGPATAKYRELGTATNLLLFNRLRSLPTRNFQEGSFEGIEQLAPETLAQTRARTRSYCAACTIGCEHLYSIAPQDSEGSSSSTRIEYENLFALGPLCGIKDSHTVLIASKLCDEQGLDTISVGGTIAFAMECVERGLLDAPWLRFGDGQALLRAIRDTAALEGIGRQLALGSRRLAKQLGNNAIDFAPQVKGLELPGYEPRALQTMALGFAVGSRGADHNRSGAYEADFSEQVDRHNISALSATKAIETEDKAALMDSLIICKFLRGVFDDFYAESAEMLNLVTGWNTTAAELQTTAQRIVTARKEFNIHCGWTPEEDRLPARMMQKALNDDEKARISPEEFAAAVKVYNQLRGWSDEGWLDPSE